MDILITSIIVIGCLIFSSIVTKFLWKGFEMMFKFAFVTLLTIVLSAIFIYLLILR